jgi:hypothetical protein
MLFLLVVTMAASTGAQKAKRAGAKDGDTHPVLCRVCYRRVTRSRIRC